MYYDWGAQYFVFLGTKLRLFQVFYLLVGKVLLLLVF